MTLLLCTVLIEREVSAGFGVLHDAARSDPNPARLVSPSACAEAPLGKGGSWALDPPSIAVASRTHFVKEVSLICDDN